MITKNYSAEFRKLPPRTANIQALPPQAAAQGDDSKNAQLGTPEGFVPSKKVYAPVHSDNLNIDPVIDSINISRSDLT